MADSKVRNAALGGGLAGCMLGFLCGGGAVALIIFARPGPDPERDCRAALELILEDEGETWSERELDREVDDCVEEMAEDPDVARTVECVLDAKNAREREDCL